MSYKDKEAEIHNSINKEYWDGYYAQGLASREPSLFAKSVLEKVQKEKVLVELGCGNGRDALFFSEHHFNIVAVDLSEKAIELLKPYTKQNISFVCGDFIHMDYAQFGEIGGFYSRFTIHALKEEQQNLLIEHVYNSLCPNGLFFIEVRSVQDDLYGKGEQTEEKDAYIYGGHYRRFIHKDELEKILLKQGFMIEYSKEDKGFALYEGTDPIVLRVIAKKP